MSVLSVYIPASFLLIYLLLRHVLWAPSLIFASIFLPISFIYICLVESVTTHILHSPLHYSPLMLFLTCCGLPRVVKVVVRIEQ